MLCDDVRRWAYFFLDGSLSERKRSDLQAHLDLCSDCEGRLLIHRKLRRLIRERVRTTAPDSFRIRLTQSLRATTAE